MRNELNNCSLLTILPKHVEEILVTIVSEWVQHSSCIRSYNYMENHLYTMWVISSIYDTDTLCNCMQALTVWEAHASCAPSQGQQYWLWESVSAASSYTYLARARTILAFSYHVALALTVNRHNVLRGSVQVSEAPHLKTWLPSFHKCNCILCIMICTFYK